MYVPCMILRRKQLRCNVLGLGSWEKEVDDMRQKRPQCCPVKKTAQNLCRKWLPPPKGVLKCPWLVPFSKSQTAPGKRNEVRVTREPTALRTLSRLPEDSPLEHAQRRVRHARKNQEAVRRNRRVSALKTRLLPSKRVAAGLGIGVSMTS